MNPTRTFVVASALVATLFLSGRALAANGWSTDYSDLWINPNEAGWGVNLAHQQDIIFMTMFVYGADGSAKWYVASSMKLESVLSGVYSGPLYQTTGPYLGGPFNPSSVVYREVGAATLDFRGGKGAIGYEIDGVKVNKSIQRYAFRANPMSGTFVGATVGVVCADPQTNLVTTRTGRFVVVQTDTNVSITASYGNGLTCTYSGPYAQAGRMGRIDGGTASCSNGRTGSFSADEIESSYKGFFGRYVVDFPACVERANIGGMKENVSP